MVVFDNTFLSQLLYEKSNPPLDPSSGRPVERAKERIEFLIKNLREGQEKIIIPTPVLTELLAIIGKPQECLEVINSSRWFEIHPFDQRSAIECGEFIRAAIKLGKREISSSTWAKAKFDFQIIAIAIVAGANTIYSDDEDIHRYLAEKPIKVVRMSELPLPPPQQMPLPNGV
jgi:hypothetical protein